MKKLSILGAACLLLASAAGAAEIHGTLTADGKPVAQGTALKLECGGASASATTDEFGSYSLKTPAAGECRLTVAYKGSNATLPVTVYEKPSRYDLVLKEAGGKVTLARK